jgi:hypothetical protein
MRRTLFVLLLGLALVPACSDDGGGDDRSRDTAEVEPDSSVADLTDEEQAVVETAQAWIDEEADLEDEQRAALRFTGIATTPAVSNVSFGQFVDDHPIRGAELVVHVLADGSVQGATNALSDAVPADDVDPIEESRAEENAGKAVEGRPEEVGPSSLIWVPSGSALTLAWSVPVTATDPPGSWAVAVDAGSGEVIDVLAAATDRAPVARRAPWSPRRVATAVFPAAARVQPGGDACDPGPAPSACLFIPDPIYAAGGSRPSADQANDVLEGRELERLDDATHLVGEFVDTEPPQADGAPPVEPDGTWAAGRARPGIEHAMAYYWIDFAHRALDRLGFGDVWARPIPVVAVDTAIVDNAQWDGEAIRLGVGSDGINEGEDASGIIHEYGHAVLGEQAPVLWNGAEAGAYHEGFGDLLAWLVTIEERTGDQGCLFPWTEEDQCLRRLDTDLVYPDDLINEVHTDGTIYTGAIWDIVEGLLAEDGIDIDDCPGSDDCGEVRDRVLATLLTSHGYLVEGTTLPDVAAAFVSANEAAFGGDDEELLDEVFADHGLDGGGGDTMDPTGDIDEPEEGITSVEFEIAHSYRGDLDVEVGVLGPDDEELCEPISLHRPDSADGEDNLTGLTDVSETDCAGFVPPAEDQRWFLRAVDTLPEDEGEIRGFTVYDGEDPYPAPGLPRPIADADPEGTTVLVDASGETDDGGMDGETDPDDPFFALAVEHSYVGDLSVTAGVLDGEGIATCSVQVLQPHPGEAGEGGLSGRIGMGACADQYPPGDDTRWFVEVVDTAAVDEGEVTELRLHGPDGDTIEFGDLPATIPDDDPEGLLLVTDGGVGAPGISGPEGEGPTLDVVIDHPYAGDLSVEVGAVDAAGGVVCQEQVATPNPADSEPGFELNVVVEDCAGDFPPDAGVELYLFVVDTLAADTGRLVEATLTGGDGVHYAVEETRGRIPDADPEGRAYAFVPA